MTPAAFALGVLLGNATWCRADPLVDCTDRVEALASTLRTAAERHNVPWSFVFAVAWVETRWNPWAVGPRGSRGIMQIHPVHGCRSPFLCSESYREWCRTEPAACQEPIAEYGARVLARMRERCGSWRAALRRYNTGRCKHTRAGERYRKRIRDAAADFRRAAGRPQA